MIKLMPNEAANPIHLRKTAGRVAVAVGGMQMFEAAAPTAASGHRFFEFRLDSLPSPETALPQLAAFLEANPGVTAIATCRRTENGGSFNGTAQQQLAILTQAAKLGCGLVDIETETAEETGGEALTQLREAGAAVILSWHDFNGTPELQPQLDRMLAFSPDYAKIVPTAKTLRDSLKLVDLLAEHGGNGRLIAMSMGFKGILTRVLGPSRGSAFTFAAAKGHTGTAPGQVDLPTLRDLYRIDDITLQTAIYAVSGEPITGSLSPRMHNTAFAACGTDAVYLPLETADVEELIEVIHTLNVRGLSITMPLKETVMPKLSFRHLTVEKVGACNTLLRDPDGALAGFNTDVAGIVFPLARLLGEYSGQRMPLKDKRVLVLGAGGAARAAVFGLTDAGAQVFILNRTESRAASLAGEFHAHVQPRDTLAETHFDVIINTTPFGMKGQQHEAPITAAEMNCKLFFDTVYNPVQTPLMQMAAERNIHTLPGYAMFVEQGVQQFTLWTENTAPEGEMARAVKEALGA